jgi:hypothetical protein
MSGRQAPASTFLNRHREASRDASATAIQFHQTKTPPEGGIDVAE